MDSHVLKKAAYRLPAMADLAVLRFNTRGRARRGDLGVPSTSPASEQYDVAAAIELAEFWERPALPRRWLVGGPSGPTWR